MIKEIKMFTVICDNCGKDSNEGTEYAGWADTEQAEVVADSSDFLKVEGSEPIYEVKQYRHGMLPEWIETNFSYYCTCHVANRRKVDKPIIKHYCPECVSYDDEDNLILKNVMP